MKPRISMITLGVADVDRSANIRPRAPTPDASRGTGQEALTQAPSDAAGS
jgi:hypothetical protein